MKWNFQKIPIQWLQGNFIFPLEPLVMSLIIREETRFKLVLNIDLEEGKMKAYRKIFVNLSVTFLFLLSISVNLAFATGSIVGTVSMVVEEGSPLPLFNVQFFDAIKAEVVAMITTAADGTFNSGPLLQGNYKIRFEYSDLSKAICISEYFGEVGTHSDVFDTANIVNVLDGQETSIAAQVSSNWSICEPRDCNPITGGLSGIIVDAKTLNPLPGIKVRVKNAENAVQLLEFTTDNSGYFGYSNSLCTLPFFPPVTDVKVRLLDPSELHIPEYVGASGTDTFELGSVLNLIVSPVINEDLAQITPAQQIGQLVEDVVKLPLPETAASTLVKLANQAKNFLEDTNPNNDKSACGILKGFDNQLKGLVARGEITQVEADALLNSAIEIRNNLGCNP